MLQELAAAARQVSVVEAMIHTALWTRPPIVRGFELSDMWAWLRYFPAVDDGPRLGLRPEWSELDPHQKTILSDELGVGFVTCVLAQHLDLSEFVETRYFLDVLLPGQFSLGRTARRGLRKAPDYLSRSPSGGVVVLECKGTQSSGRVLEDAIRLGIAQKRNLTAAGSTPIEHSLVGGLFIPQAANPERATIVFADPDWEETNAVLAREEPRRVHRAILQIFLAKALALLGYGVIAQELVHTPASDIEETGRSARWRIALPAQPMSFTFPMTVRPGGNRVQATFSVAFPPGLRRSLEGGNLREAIDEISGHREWERVVDDQHVAVTTPHGFRWSLDVSAAG